MKFRSLPGVVVAALAFLVAVASPAAPRVAVLDFVRADSPGGVDPALADFSRAVQAKLLTDDRFAWVERQEFERIMHEADPGGTNGFDPATAVRLGRLLQADLLLKGDVAQTAGGKAGAELVVEVIDLRRAEVLARRAVPIAMNARQKLHPTTEEVAAGTAAAQAVLEEARTRMEQFAGLRTLAPLYFRNIGASDRLDFLEAKLRAALPAAATTDTGLRVLEYPRTSEAGEESSLVLSGLTDTDPEAWRSVADFYVWGSFQEERADGVVFEEAPVTVVLQVATPAGATKEVRWNGPVKALDAGLAQLARDVVEATQALGGVQIAGHAGERGRLAQELRRRAAEIDRQIMAGGYQFLAAPAGRQLYAYQVRLLEVACFFDPQNDTLQRARVDLVWASRNPSRPLETLRGQWLRLADYRTQARRFSRRPDGSLDEQWPVALEESARAAARLMHDSESKAREFRVSPEEMHRQLGVMVEQWSEVVVDIHRAATNEPKASPWYAKRRAEWFAGAQFLRYIGDPLIVHPALVKTWAVWEPELGRLMKDPAKEEQARGWAETLFSACGALGDQDHASAMLDSAWKSWVAEKAVMGGPLGEPSRAAPPARVDRPWAPRPAKVSGFPTPSPNPPGKPLPPVLQARFREIESRTIRGWRRARDLETSGDLLTKNMAMHVNALAWRAGRLWLSETGEALPKGQEPAGSVGGQYLWIHDPALRTSELVSAKLGAHSSVRTVQFAEKSTWLGFAADGVWRLEDNGTVQRYKGEDGLQMMQIRDAVGDEKELFYLGGTLLRQTISIFSLQEKHWSGAQVPLPSPLAEWLVQFTKSSTAADAQPPGHLAASGDWLCFSGLWTAFYHRTTKEWKTIQARNPMAVPMALSADEKGFWFATGNMDVTSVWFVDPAKPDENQYVLLPPGFPRAMVQDGPWLWVAINRVMAKAKLALVDKRTLACVGVLDLPMNDVTCLTAGGGRLWVGGAKRPPAPGYPSEGFALVEIADVKPAGLVASEEIAPADFPVLRATWRGDLDAVERLLEEKMDPNAGPPRRGWTALMEAAAAGRPDLIQRLLAAGADPNRISSEGETALQQAVLDGSAESVRLLLERNAKPNLRPAAKIRGFTAPEPVRLETPVMPATSLPPPPENVKVTATTEGEVLLTWDDRADNETGYEITQQNSAGSHLVVAQLPANTARWLDPERRDETRLVYTVEAVNEFSHRSTEMRRVEVSMVRPQLSDRVFRSEQGFMPDGVETMPVRLLAQTPLALAASAGRTDLIELLLVAGADPDLADAAGYTPLLQAVRHRQYAAARQLLAHKAKPEIVADTGETASLLAYQWHEDEALWEALLQAVPAGQRAAEATRLMLEAAGTGQLADMKKLRGSGGNLGDRIEGFDTPLRRAWQADQVDTVQWLLAEQAEWLRKQLRSGKLSEREAAIVGAAVHNNRPELFGKLLDLGLNVDQVVDGNPLVVMAARDKAFGVLVLLRDRGADLKAMGSASTSAADGYLTVEQRQRYLSASAPGGATPTSWPLPRLSGIGIPGPSQYAWQADPAKLEVNVRLITASREGRLAEVKQALVDGAEIDGYGAAGRTALMEAMQAGAFDVVHWLVEEGASVNRTSEAGESPVTFAVALGKPDELDYLLQMGADPNLYGQGGLPPLAVAARAGRLDLMRRLLSAGANPNVTADIRHRRESVLAVALWSGQVEAVDLLLASGVNPRSQTYTFIGDGDKPGTPVSKYNDISLLMFAAYNGRLELIKKMVALGQDPKKRTFNGADALSWAAWYERKEAVEFLLPLSNMRGYALKSARTKGNKEIIHLLEQAGYKDAGD